MKLLSTLQQLVKEDDTAEKLWSILKTKFGQQGLAATFVLYQKINSWRMKESMDSYYVQVPALMDYIGRASSQGLTL